MHHNFRIALITIAINRYNQIKNRINEMRTIKFNLLEINTKTLTNEWSKIWKLQIHNR